MLGAVDKGCIVCDVRTTVLAGLCEACEKAYQEYLANRPAREGTRADSSSKPVKSGRPANPWSRYQWAAFQRTRRAKEGAR